MVTAILIMPSYLKFHYFLEECITSNTASTILYRSEVDTMATPGLAPGAGVAIVVQGAWRAPARVPSQTDIR